MFLGHTNPKLCVLVNAIVLYVCKLTELRKKQLKVKISNDLKELKKRIFKFYLAFKIN